MKTLTSEDLVGKRIEGIFEASLPSRPDFENKLVLVKLQGLGFVPLELADPDALPPLRLHTGDPGSAVTDNAVKSLLGKKVLDVIVSKYLASVSLLCDDGRVLTND